MTIGMGEKKASITNIFATDTVISIVVAIAVCAVLTYFNCVWRINTPLRIAVGASGFVLILSQLGGIASLFGFFLLIRARTYFQARADLLLSTERRKPILFLRSFYDDQKQRVDNAAKAIVDFSLEVRLANHFTYFGPFIAVRSPMETVPQLGASTSYAV